MSDKGRTYVFLRLIHTFRALSVYLKRVTTNWDGDSIWRPLLWRHLPQGLPGPRCQLQTPQRGRRAGTPETSCGNVWMTTVTKPNAARSTRASLRRIAQLSGSSILQRGETSWNTKRRWRQKVSHLLKAPSSLPNTRAADHLDFQSDRPLNSHQVQRCRTVKNSPNVVSLEFAIVVIYSYKLQAIQIAEGMIIYLTRCLLGTWLKMQNRSEDLRRSRN